MDGYQIIGLLGDSIANGYWDEEKGGWFNRLTERLKKQKPKAYTFCNMAKGGDNCIDIYHRLLSEAAGREIETLIIAGGINDIIQSSSESQISSLTRQMTWHKILTFAQKNFSRVLVLGIAPALEGEIKPYNVFIFNAEIEEYNRQLAEWCAEHDVAFYSPYQACQQWKEDMYEDNVHPNAKGHQAYEQLVYNQLKELGFI